MNGLHNNINNNLNDNFQGNKNNNLCNNKKDFNNRINHNNSQNNIGNNKLQNIKKQELLKVKDKFNKEYLIIASRDKTIKLWGTVGGVCIFIFTGKDN